MTHRPPAPGPAKRKLAVVPLRPDGEVAPRRRSRAKKALPAIEPARVEQALAQMAAHLGEAAGLAESQRSLLAVVHELAKPRACFIARHAAERELLQISSVRGRNDPRIAAARPGEGPLGQAFSQRRIIREEGLVAAPTLSGDAATGALVLLSPRYELTDGQLQALAAQISAGMSVARLSEEATLRTKDLQTAVVGLKALEKTREQMLANISHDLKNPLTTIKTYLALLQRSSLGELTEKQRKAVTTCDRNADRLLRMINDLLLISRLQAGSMQLDERPFGLKDVAEEVVQALSSQAAQSQVKLVIPPCAEVYVKGDRGRIAEAISNLVETALHRCPAEGAVEVRIATADGGLASVSVRDDGPMLADEELKHLFDTYYRPPGAGASGHRGLALPLAAKIVHLHGGRIEAGSGRGRGCSLRIYLPMFAGAVSMPEGGFAPRMGEILLVEDDADCRDVLQQVLEMEGYRVVAAASATEARSLLEEMRPALVLLDLRLSEEDGMSVLHFIRKSEALSDVAVYLISGAREVASLSGGQGIERIDGFFEKPLQVAKVLDTVAAVVRPTLPIPSRD